MPGRRGAVSDRHATPSGALRSTGAIWIIGPLWCLATEAITASAFPGYSYARNDISDLGVPERGVLQGRVLDSPLHAVMNAGFSDGIWERGSVYTFLAWQVMTGVSLLHRRIQGAG